MLAGGSTRTAWGRGDSFLLERRCGVLVDMRVLVRSEAAEPNGMCVENTMFTHHISYPCPMLHLYIAYIVGLFTFIQYHQHLIRSSVEDIRRRRHHVINGMTITLDSGDCIRPL